MCVLLACVCCTTVLRFICLLAGLSVLFEHVSLIFMLFRVVDEVHCERLPAVGQAVGGHIPVEAVEGRLQRGLTRGV